MISWLGNAVRRVGLAHQSHSDPMPQQKTSLVTARQEEGGLSRCLYRENQLHLGGFLRLSGMRNMILATRVNQNHIGA
jgi:hypothetical protein